MSETHLVLVSGLELRCGVEARLSQSPLGITDSPGLCQLDEGLAVLVRGCALSVPSERSLPGLLEAARGADDKLTEGQPSLFYEFRNLVDRQLRDDLGESLYGSRL